MRQSIASKIKIICEAQDNNCFMSGSHSGYSALCGENSKDEENLKDPMEIMKRAKEFLEKQNKILLDPMTWTIPPLSSLQTFPPPTVSTAPVASKSHPLHVFQPTVQSQSPYIPLYSEAMANNVAYSLLTPISKNPANIPNLKFLPYIGLVSSDKSKVLQNSPISVNQANFPHRLENSVQLTGSQQQFQNQADDIVNKMNEMPHLIKILPPLLSSKSFTQYQSQEAKDNNDLTDMNSTEPIKLFLNRRFIYQKTTH
uniref:Uncharacterized protein n=1 Tax=Onchocerca volvulus TaxID=6282 RepID=A0A8R1TVZ8_ONCVO